MHSSAIDPGAKETYSRRLTMQAFNGFFLPTCFGGRKQANVFEGEEGFIQKSCHVYIYFKYFLCSALILKTAIIFQMTQEVQPDHITTTNQAL